MIYTKEQIKLIKTELTPTDTEEMFEEFLNECYPEIDIIGLKYQAGSALKVLDPVAFRCGHNDFVDSEVSNEVITDEIDGEHYDLYEVNLLLEEHEKLDSSNDDRATAP